MITYQIHCYDNKEIYTLKKKICTNISKHMFTLIELPPCPNLNLTRDMKQEVTTTSDGKVVPPIWYSTELLMATITAPRGNLDYNSVATW